MKRIFSKRRNTSIALSILAGLVFLQAFVIAKLWSERTDKTYEVNLVKINNQKDSVDYLKMKNNMVLLDNTVGDIRSFLADKNITNATIEMLDQDSISDAVYLAKQSNRYSQYLVDLEKKLQQVPLGIPTDGYVSSNFGKRKNPIPFKTVLASAKPATSASAPVSKPAVITAAPAAPKRKAIGVRIVEEKDSAGNVKQIFVPIYGPEPEKPAAGSSAPAIAANAPSQPAISAPMSDKKAAPVKEVNNPPAEADQIQFHKGIDIAVPYGTDVRNAAAGTVIFAGTKGGYGNCVIISHGNGMATLYAHLSQLLVKTNDVVKVNQVIAKSGNSGRSTGPHLHYEVHKNNTPVNPKLFLNF